VSNVLSKLRLPSPALVVATVALFVAVGGTALAATPVVKRALFADNAGKLQKKTVAQIAAIPGPATKLDGKTSAQIVDEAAKLPGPASTAAGLVVVKTAPFALAADDQRMFTVQCDPGQKAVNGGYAYDSNALVISVDNAPTGDGGGWQIYLFNASDSTPASGTVNAVCLK
jgi:hypothetical protein